MGNYDDYLSHHGVLGMKWGIIRKRNQDKVPRSKKARYKKELKDVNEKAVTLTNQQLRAAIERKRLQNEYLSLYKPIAQKSRKQKIVESTMGVIGEGVKSGVKSIASSATKAAGKKIAAKYFNLELKDEKKKT